MAQAFSPLVSRGHAVRRRGREMRASVHNQPAIGVTNGHIEKVDRYHVDDRLIWTVDIAHGDGFAICLATAAQRCLMGRNLPEIIWASKPLARGDETHDSCGSAGPRNGFGAVPSRSLPPIPHHASVASRRSKALQTARTICC